MSDQRLSKLQKWILLKCYKQGNIYSCEIKEYFGKEYIKKTESITIRDECELIERYGKNYKEEYDIEERIFYSGDNRYRDLKIVRKKELCITNSVKAVISRSLKGLVKKGLLIKDRPAFTGYGDYKLTKEGCLKANSISMGR